MDRFQGVAKVTDQLWDKVLSVNLYAPMVLSRATLQPDNVAALALFLASDESRMINGALVNADGGWGSY